jgi:hypothetical protein
MDKDIGARTRSRTIIVTPEDEAMLGEVAAAHPLVSRHRIAQVALRCGLRAFRTDPARLVQEAMVSPVAGHGGGAP